MANNQRKVVVAYRVVPGDPNSAVVVTTENLMADEHDSLMKLVDSAAGQQADELATVMARSQLPDGRNMLAAFHSTGKMVKVPTNSVQMTPATNSSIMLNELNELIAEQRGVTVADLAITDKNAPVKKAENKEVADTPAQEAVVNDAPLTDEDLARRYRSEANTLFKEAKRLREMAEELVPTKRTTTKNKESA